MSYSFTSEAASRKRRVFFSFYFLDIMRVNNVRNCGEFKKDSSASSVGRSIEGFYDYSLWESKKTNGPASVKALINDGIHNTSCVCVLVGSDTWARRWVRYEIAQGVADGRGLLAVHINNINHHKDGKPHVLGKNPLDFMGVGKVQATPSAAPVYYLYEVNASGVWARYGDHTTPVSKPAYLPDPANGSVMALSRGTAIYDFTNNGHNKIGQWIDEAAQQVGR